ncbi:hypothetical protein ASG43_17330 [Aureimonas sp. Leaf454]|nr:hypothetical protein ASG43_17330 [Aureimonas sp. Leaf454]
MNPLYQGKVDVPEEPKIAPRDVKASSGMMSGSELIEKMGGAPKSDFTIMGKTLKTNSNEYKAALSHLETYQTKLSKLGGEVGDVRTRDIQALKTDLNKVITDADAYADKHAGSSTKSDRREVMADLKAMAQKELQLLDRLGDLVNTKGKGITVADGLVLLRGGVTDASGYNKDLNDSIIDKGKSKDSFASGKANSVSLISYGTEMRVVKSISKEAEKLMAGESSSGFDQSDMRTAARNIASSNVAEKLGIGKTIPMSDIVVHNGQAAIAMKLAKSESLILKTDVPVTDQKLVQQYNHEFDKGWHDNLKGYGVTRTENGDWTKKQTGFKDIPYTGTSNPPLTANIQKGLLDLQVADCLMAQMDRQPENIFIQISGTSAQIIGIDNDMCMGKAMTDLEPTRPDLKKTYGGPPPLMSREMFDKLQAMTPESFKEAIGPEFTQEEVDAGLSRLAKLKEHANALKNDGMIVDNFETWKGIDPTSGEEMNASDFLMASDFRSYVKRDQTTLNKIDVPIPLDLGKH